MIEILYFSGTGNTAFVAEQIEKQLKARGEQVERKALETVHPDEAGTGKLLYFGFPIYACASPVPVAEFIRGMKTGKPLKVKLFATKAYFSGKALSRTGMKLEERGFEVLSTFETKMPGSDGLAFLRKESRAAQRLLQNFSGVIGGLEAWVEKDHFIPWRRRGPDIVGCLFSLAMKQAEHSLASRFTADAQCNLCRLCIRICPAANISENEGSICFGKECFLCMRCLHQCPKEAIQIGSKTVGRFRYKGPTGDFHPLKELGNYLIR